LSSLLLSTLVKLTEIETVVGGHGVAVAGLAGNFPVTRIVFFGYCALLTAAVGVLMLAAVSVQPGRVVEEYKWSGFLFVFSATRSAMAMVVGGKADVDSVVVAVPRWRWRGC
jgi:hypothetical protein